MPKSFLRASRRSGRGRARLKSRSSVSTLPVPEPPASAFAVRSCRAFRERRLHFERLGAPFSRKSRYTPCSAGLLAPGNREPRARFAGAATRQGMRAGFSRAAPRSSEAGSGLPVLGKERSTCAKRRPPCSRVRARSRPAVRTRPRKNQAAKISGSAARAPKIFASSQNRGRG